MSKYIELVKQLKKMGMKKVGQAKGSHERWAYSFEDGAPYIIIPNHKGKEIATGTKHQILKWAKINKPDQQ